ncbi:MAG TPA: cytochrome c biogenesis protein CcdC [Bacillota bacterium]|nr:cytochrome c biogenesis protein CcdC [Bacillota bacterium]
MHTVGLAIGIVFAVFIIIMRIKKSKKPIQLKNIVLPPFFMSTGFLMFIYPTFRPDLIHIFLALLIGSLFSIPLIWTTSFEFKGSDVYVKPSKIFILTLIGLFVARTLIRIYASESISETQSSGMFFIMAFGMVLPWRIGMLIKYRNLHSFKPIREK